MAEEKPAGLDYDTFKQHQERYEREKKDKEDAEKWRHQEETRAQSRDKPKDEPPKKEPVPADHPFKK